MINKKKCKECSLEKEVYNFYKRKTGSFFSYCKTCHNKINTRKKKTTTELSPEKGLLSRYYGIKSRCGKLQHYKNIKCLFNKKEFIERYKNDITYNNLFSQWKDSNKKPNLRPSVDRIDSKGHYEFSNIRWITSGNNSKKAMFELYLRQKQVRSIPVVQLSKSGQEIARYNSLLKAAKAMGAKNNGSNISDVCKGKLNMAYGHKWKYVEN